MCLIPPDTKWSFSRLETFAHCPMSFKLKYLDKVPDEDNAFGEYGTFCHSLLEQWAKGELPDFLLAEAYDEGYDSAVVHRWPPFPKGMPEKYYQQGLEYFQNFEGFGNNYEVLSVEEKFELNIGGYRFVGLADLVLRDIKTGEITVIDHKSKSMSTMKKDLPTFRKQLYVYAAYVKERFGVYPKYLKFNVFRENEWVTEEFDQDAFDATMKWVVDTIEEILYETEWKVSSSSYFCRFVCGVLGSCPARDAILYPPKKEKDGEKQQQEPAPSSP